MIVLTPAELIEVTAKKRPHAQARVLDSMEIPYRPRPDGSLVVLRIHVETIEGAQGRLRPDIQPEPELVLEQ